MEDFLQYAIAQNFLRSAGVNLLAGIDGNDAVTVQSLNIANKENEQGKAELSGKACSAK